MTADEHEPSLERQMGGCMAGFFHLFDRTTYIPSSKRYVSSKSLLLLPSSDTESLSPSEKSDASATFLTDQSPNVTPSLKGASWKYLEGSRLSLDSRAVTDAKGKLHRRSPGAVARLMGLEALPDQDVNSKPAMLRRSSSESRARNDPSFYQFVDATAFEKASPFRENTRKQKNNSFIQRKSFELFPTEQPKRVGTMQPAVPVSLYCEIERRLRVRGIEEPAKDLETLKQVLEAVQLRGLLHSKQYDGYGTEDMINGYHRSSGSPLVLMKPAIKPSRSPRRDPRSDKQVPQAVRSTDRSRRVAKSEVRRGTDRKISPVGSPVGSPRKVVPGPGTVRSDAYTNRRRVGNVVQRGKSTGTGTVSDKRIKSPLQYDWEEERTGRNLLERCDQLLYSIAAITATDQNSSEDLQPSPVSVLDSAFQADECSPSPKIKRSLHFQDQPFDWAHEQSNDEMSTIGSDCCDPDYMLVAEIMRYSDRCHDSSKLLASLGKHPKFCGTGTSPHHHRLLYDLVCEMLNHHRHISTWETFKCTRSTSAQLVHMPDSGHVWQQIQKLKEPIITNEVVDVTSTAISKDMAADHTWSHKSVELSDTVLQIERMIFKDLIADSIHELSDVASVSYHLPRRKLIF